MVDGTSGLRGTARGRLWSLPTFLHLFCKFPSATTLCPLRSGEDGLPIGRRSGRHPTGGNGAKKPTSVRGVNARSAGVEAKGEAAHQDSPSKDVANARPATVGITKPMGDEALIFLDYGGLASLVAKIDVNTGGRILR